MAKMSDKVKVRVHDPQQGFKVIKEMTAYEIVKSPNYHEPEAIIMALCKCVADLCDSELERRESIKNIMNSVGTLRTQTATVAAEDPAQMKLPL